MIDALMGGFVTEPPTHHTSASSGHPYVRVMVETKVGAATHLIRVAGFAEPVLSSLAGLTVGQSVALAGSLRIAASLNTRGEPRPRIQMTCRAVLSVENARDGVSHERA